MALTIRSQRIFYFLIRKTDKIKEGFSIQGSCDFSNGCAEVLISRPLDGCAVLAALAERISGKRQVWLLVSKTSNTGSHGDKFWNICRRENSWYSVNLEEHNPIFIINYYMNGNGIFLKSVSLKRNFCTLHFLFLFVGCTIKTHFLRVSWVIVY